MHHLATLACTNVELSWSRDLLGSAALRARQLRCALANAFADDSRFHQHDSQGYSLYRYPLIQYRWQHSKGQVIGWLEGAEMLRTLPWLDLGLCLGQDKIQVNDALINCTNTSFYISERMHHYRLASPILLFNQKNHQRYQTMSKSEQILEQDRLLRAALLSAMRGFHIEFSTRLYATFIQVKHTYCHYKGQRMIGLLGRFMSNAGLPSGFAAGRSVSHGFGWIIPE